MDRRVKERFVGATILVVLVVLIVPELLSGPRRASVPPATSVAGLAEPIRNVTVDLATSKATEVEPASAASAAGLGLSAESADPPTASQPIAMPVTPPLVAGELAGATDVPASTSPATTAASVENQPAPHRRVDGKPQATTAARAGATAKARWAVQLGSFANRANAEKLVMRVKPSAPSAYVASSGAGAAVRYRVRVGPLADRSAAERVVAKLKREGLAASLVHP